MTQLYSVEEADMHFIKRKTGLTWGNLSGHSSKLEEEGYVEIVKSIEHKRTKTILKLTPEGRKAFERYRATILKLLS